MTDVREERGAGTPPGDGESRSRWVLGIEGLAPGYFALVMGTGIISLGLHLEGHETLSRVLFAVAALAYVVLLCMSVVRVAFFPSRVMADLAGPRNGFSFFTFVAGTNVLGARIAAEGYVLLPAIMLALSFLTWLVLGYLIPGMVLSRYVGEDILRGLNGTWFIWSVASQSVAVLAASLEPHGREPARRPRDHVGSVMGDRARSLRRDWLCGCH